MLAYWWLTIPQVGVVKVMSPISAFWSPGHIFGANRVRHLAIGMQIDRKEYWYLHVKIPQYGGHVTFLKFWEVSANISEKVQARDIVTEEDW